MKTTEPAPRNNALRKLMANDAAAALPRETEIARLRDLVMLHREKSAELAVASVAVSRLAEEVRTLEQDTIPSLFDQIGGIEKLMLDDGTEITVTTQYHPACLKDDEPKFFSWLRKHNFDAIIKRQIQVAFGKGEDKNAAKVAAMLAKAKVAFQSKEFVHPQTLKAFVRERMEKGAVLPPELQVNDIRTAIIKAKGK